MATDTINTKEIFTALDKTSTELLQLVSSTAENIINTVPYRNSWTAAQLATHINKSNKAIGQALNMEGKVVERDPGARIGELKSMFLNFDIKFKSPEFIRPEVANYQKAIVVSDLKKSIEQLRTAGHKTVLTEIINLPAFGEITKLELLYFVLYHTQRHIHQLKNILSVLQN
jgi:hypothetical protein